MARKPLSVWEKEQKKKFDKKIKEYSVSAVENIWKIANNALDQKTRLSANIWLADKAVGRGYVGFTDETEQRTGNVTINLIPTGSVYEMNERDEQAIYEAENEDIEDEEEWGEEIYNPTKEQS